MRIPKQCPDVLRGLEAPAVDANTVGVVPAGFLDTLKGIGMNALRGAVTSARHISPA